MNNSLDMKTFYSAFLALQFDKYLNKMTANNNDWSIQNSICLVERINLLNNSLEKYIDDDMNNDECNATIKECGELLNEIGGICLMSFVGDNLIAIEKYPYASDKLNWLWNGIGEWLA
jgi:hypothetical protein